jgi:hypothetical protein
LGRESPSVTDPGSSSPSSRSSAPPKAPAPTQAYELCGQQARAAASEGNYPAPRGKLKGKVAVDNPQGTTVVVTDDKWTWACNVFPDLAVSLPGRAAYRDPGPDDFAIASSCTNCPEISVEDPPAPPGLRTPTPGVPPPRFVYWGGGNLPLGYTSVTFAFPDGNIEKAVTSNGSWVLQYFPERDFDWNDKRIRVVVRSSDSSAGFELEWGDHTCNNMAAHGC